MPFKFGSVSLSKFKGVHPDLVKVAERAIAISTVDFKVLEGLRSAAKQLAAYKAGKSKIKSGGRHQSGHAIDIQALDPETGKPTWVTSTKLYHRINDAFQKASKELGIPIRWGGTFSFGDYGHFELTKAKYPA